MAFPKPETALHNVCTVIFENTLYTYSADAFQSLELDAGAKWKTLPQGEKITGGVCVLSATGNPMTAAFFVVGGRGGDDQYMGMQKYTFSTGKWESVTLDTWDIKNRVGHSAVYLESSDSILVYSGSQADNLEPSSQTFTVGASAPHSVISYPSYAPPVTKPILLRWSPSEAVMLGGSASNTQVFLFSRETQWIDSGATLASPLSKDTSAIQAALLTGDDGSKNLITFDTSQSPNLVQRTVLFTGPGLPAPNAAPVRKRALRRRQQSVNSKAKRQSQPLNLQNWPTYDRKFEPTAIRINSAIAIDPFGMIVLTGGNDQTIISVFDAKKNAWLNETAMLAPVRPLSADPSSTSTATSTTATLTATTSSVSSTLPAGTTDAAVAVPDSPNQSSGKIAGANYSGPSVNTILGAVLGSIFGLALILGLLYFCMRKRQREQAHNEAGHMRRSSGIASGEKVGIGYSKDRTPYGPGPAGGFRGHQPQDSKSSFSSLAILMGRENKPRLPPLGSGSKRDSGDSVFKAFKSTISKPIVADATQQAPASRDEKGVAFAAGTAEPRPRNLALGANDSETRRSSGWNRYWSGGSALNFLGFGGGNNNNNNAQATSQRTTLHSERSSNYSNQHNNRMTQDSVTVPRLQINEPRLSFSRVNSGSPTVAVYPGENKYKQGMSAQIETANRPVSAVSEGSFYSSGVPESVQEAWDPTASNKPWGSDRSQWGSDRSQTTSYTYNTNIYSTALAPPVPQGSRGNSGADFPPPLRKQPSPVRDDMSWLNLGPN
ncbi:hypothetical protein QBC38DRAFT_355523 [Podospora fimiseda]|uniref:Pre-mRNA splicing factor CLF1 n=1 Tax=Podospora fimiseda TaxID=252190 RepID=A0AAN7BWH6_9PEZI|nr:hypothetical protein QBC38DRAFT_355523 [Podospora fimiseda]